MAYFERKQEILDFLKINKTATVEQLSEQLYVSPATVRRDLIEMQRLGLIERTHGGAVLVEGSDEISILIRKAKNAKEKDRTVRAALRHIPEFSTAFIDNSSTCLALAERMNFQHKTVVTNGLHIALCLSRQDDVSLVIPGGEIRGNTTAVLGSMTINALNDFRFDLALVSCAGLDSDGSYEVSLETMQTKRLALAHSKIRVLLADRTKIGVSAAYRTAQLRDYDFVVTNAEDDAIAPLLANGATVFND